MMMMILMLMMAMMMMMTMMVRMVVVMMMMLLTLMLMTTPSGRGGTPRSGRGTGHNPARVVILMMVMVVVMLVVVLILLASARTHAQLASYSGRRLAAALAAAIPFWPRRQAAVARRLAGKQRLQSSARQPAAVASKISGIRPRPGAPAPGDDVRRKAGAQARTLPCRARWSSALPRALGRSATKAADPKISPAELGGLLGCRGRSGAQGSVSGLLSPWALGRCFAHQPVVAFTVLIDR